MRVVMTIAIHVLCIGCVTVERSAYTPSGKPEVTIKNTTLDRVSSEIVNEMSARGFSLVQQSTNSMMFNKQMTGGQAIGAQLLIGNSYSTTPESEVRFMLSNSGNSVNVIADMSMSTQMAFGQVNRQPMNNNNAWFNEVHALLDKVRRNIEPTVLTGEHAEQRAEAVKVYDSASTEAPSVSEEKVTAKPNSGEPVPVSEAPPSLESISDERSGRPNESEVFAQAVAFFSRESYKEAIDGLNEYLELFPDGPNAPNAVYWIAHSSYKLADYPRAIVGFEDVCKKYPTSDKVPAAMHNGAMAYARMGQNDKAIELLEQLISAFPNDPFATGAKQSIQELKPR